MSQIMKAYTGIFLILFLTFTAAGILAAFITIADAQDMHASMVNELENSSFYPAVLEESFARAEEAGYQLSITLYQEDYTVAVCTNRNSVPQDTSKVTSAKLELTFPFQVSFLGVSSEHTFCAYAR